MDGYLKSLAAVGLALDEAESLVSEGAFVGARERVDEAGRLLAALREEWSSMSPAERGVVGRVAAPLRTRLDTLSSRIPRPRSLSDAPAEVDPEQDEEPEAA